MRNGPHPSLRDTFSRERGKAVNMGGGGTEPLVVRILLVGGILHFIDFG